jgi:hypothetical protein
MSLEGEIDAVMNFWIPSATNKAGEFALATQSPNI